MGLKIYIVATIAFIIVLFGYVHSLELGEYSFSMFDNTLTYPVSLWVILPVIVLVLATYLHIIFYGLVKYIKQKLVDSDLETVFDLISSKVSGKENKTRFRTKKFKELSMVLSQLDIDAKSDVFTSTNEELNKVVSAVQNINAGKYVSEKIIKLDESSSIAKQNLINKINEQVDFSVEVLKKSDNYDYKIVKLSFLNVLKGKSMTTVKKLYKNIKLDKELAFKLFEKDVENSEFGFSNEEIIDIIKTLNFTKNDYLELSKIYKKTLTPDKLIFIFEKLSVDFEEATSAYLFILSEFEMIDKLREVLSNTQDNEYMAFKALLDLKDAGKHYTLEELVY